MKTINVEKILLDKAIKAHDVIKDEIKLLTALLSDSKLLPA